MDAATFDTARALPAGTLARILNDIALVLASREALAVRLRAAWGEAQQALSCDHCLILSWPERDLLALCESDCPEAASDDLRGRLERHARILDGEDEVSLDERPLRAGPAELIATDDLGAAALSLPLVGPEGMLGLIHLTRAGQRPFGIEEVVLGCVIASQLAACLAHHHSQETLARASEARVRFISQVAHELRNALQPARLNLEVIQRLADLDERLQRPVERLNRSVDQMARMVNDLLDAQRVVNGLVELRRARVDLNLIAATVIENQRSAAEQKALSLKLEPSPDPVFVDGDPGRLDQILTNLVTNAIRYSDRGEVRVDVARQGDEAVVRVSDTGMGMTAETQAHVFELFRTQATDVHHGRGGLGIGLAVVKQLVELHGGSIACTSLGLGQGSEFVVRLPR
jgi:signal transduction histidine kinase